MAPRDAVDALCLALRGRQATPLDYVAPGADNLLRAAAVFIASAKRDSAASRPPYADPLTPEERDTLGRLVRQAWMLWANEQPDPKPSWLVPYDDLPEPDREADRRIGEAIARFLRAPSRT